MTDINFNITGIENLIEDLKATRCECDNKVCVNNAAWSGRNCGAYAPRCLLPFAHIDKQGSCQDIATVSPKSDIFTISGPAVEAAVEGQNLLNRVSSFATDYLNTEGRCQIPESLLVEIDDHLGKLEK